VIRNGTPYFPCYDGNGNISDYVDTNGVVVAHREYDPFGRTVVSTGPMKDAFSFWFSTKYFEPWWNLYYYGYRFYSPTLGLWISRDPIADHTLSSVYAFLANRPVHKYDYLGLLLTDAEIASHCKALHRLWDARRLVLDSAWGGRGRFWNHYVKYMGCAVEIECKECCTAREQLTPGVAWMEERRCLLVFRLQQQRCRIRVCANRFTDPMRDMESVFGVVVHELTHCFQDCNQIGTHDCESCVCNEIQAYQREYPDKTHQLLVGNARRSCTQRASEDAAPWCTQTEFRSVLSRWSHDAGGVQEHARQCARRGAD